MWKKGDINFVGNLIAEMKVEYNVENYMLLFGVQKGLFVELVHNAVSSNGRVGKNTGG